MHQTLDRAALSAKSEGALNVHCRVRDLTKRFGQFTALKSVSLDVLKGELVCFLGPSGCGKTTLLRAIAGLDIQSEGVVEIGGRDVSNLPPSERDFGIVFQSYALFPNLSIADNVGYGLVNRGMPRAKRRERVDELLALVGLSDQGVKYPIQLSGGQQQRVALARALATSPSLLLLDEPLSALDARVRVRLRDEIKALQRRLGITTIMVTHDQEEALAMADRIVVMNQGVIEQVGTPTEVYARPQTAFTADFVGTMTFLNGTLTGDRCVRVGRLELTCGSGDHGSPGTPVQLGFRPEEVQVRSIEDATPNRMLSVVGSVEYLGAFSRASLRVADAPDVVLTADFSANAMRDLGIREGQQLPIALPVSALRVFAVGGGGGGAQGASTPGLQA
jgi:iron(III) transport system ATP-binding protein